MPHRLLPGRFAAISAGSAAIAAAVVTGLASAAGGGQGASGVSAQVARLPPAAGSPGPAQPAMVAAAPADAAPPDADVRLAAEITAADPALVRLLHGASYAIDGQQVWSDGAYARRGVWLHVRLAAPRDLYGMFPELRYNRAQTAYRELLAPGVVRGARSLELLVDLVRGRVAAVVPDDYDSSADAPGEATSRRVPR